MKHTPEPVQGKKMNLERFKRFIMENYASPGTEIECTYTEDLIGAAAIRARQMNSKALSGFDRYLLTPAIIKKALEAQEQGFDAVLITNTYDPGVEAARFVVRIPVVGAGGRASCHLASMLSDRIGIIVPFESHIANTSRLMQSYGLSGFISSFVAADPPIEKDAPLEEVLRCFEIAGKKCVNEGAQIILPLCGLFVPQTISAQALAERVGIQVIDTLAVGMGLTELLIRMGLTHSDRAYPFLQMASSDIACPHHQK